MHKGSTLISKSAFLYLIFQDFEKLCVFNKFIPFKTIVNEEMPQKCGISANLNKISNKPISLYNLLFGQHLAIINCF